MSDDLRWITGRRPRPPRALLDLLERGGETVAGPGRPLRLARRGAELLEDVLRARAEDRETAFLLLEADALITYACEAAAEEADPEGSLRDVRDALRGMD